jgi:hypothetical protein
MSFIAVQENDAGRDGDGKEVRKNGSASLPAKSEVDSLARRGEGDGEYDAAFRTRGE